MSRIAKNPVVIPEKVEVNITVGEIIIKGPLGELKIFKSNVRND